MLIFKMYMNTYSSSLIGMSIDITEYPLSGILHGHKNDNSQVGTTQKVLINKMWSKREQNVEYKRVHDSIYRKLKTDKTYLCWKLK